MADPEQVDLEALRQTAPAAARLLALCAFLAPDDIPLDLLHGGQQHLPRTLAATVAEPTELDEALAALWRYARVERRDDALFVPPWLQVLVYDRLPAAERAVWTAAAVALVQAALPADSTVVETWSTYARLLPHALATTRHAEACSVVTEEMARVLNGTGVYLYRSEQFHEAHEVLERALALYESVAGRDHPATAAGLNNLAVLYTSQGRYEDAEPLLQRALAIQESVLGGEHAETATGLTSLGALYISQGRYEDAEPLLQRAITISESSLGRGHPETAISVNNLAELYHRQGRYRHAAPLLRRALTILRTTLGDRHPHTQGIQRNLDMLEQHLRDAAGGEAG